MLPYVILLCWVVKFMPNKKIGEKIANATENKGLSQRQLAHAIGISNAALSKIESGETEIPMYSRSEAIRICI